MPYRRTPIINGEIYHVFNRSIAKQPIFLSRHDFKRGIEVIKFYQYKKPSLRFSHFNRLPVHLKEKYLGNLKKNNKKNIQLFNYCLMPNHMHFLIKELEGTGISNFMRNFQNSYAKYFNLKHQRSGALFQSMFKIVRIESDEQLLHLCRYIHLNPITSYLINGVDELQNYPGSAYQFYINQQNNEFIDVNFILSFFSSQEKFVNFIADQTDYQRTLDQIKHSILEES